MPAYVAALLLHVPALARDWVEYTSDHFTLYSNAPEKRALEHVESFEEFRRVALALVGVGEEVDTSRPLIVLFDSNRDYFRLQPNRNASGYVRNSVFGMQMFVGPQGTADDARSTLFHGYVHYLLLRYSDQNYPRWFSDGYAELLSGTTFDGDTVVVGVPTESMRAALTSASARVSVEQAIELDNGQGYSVYMNGWLMVHYFLLESFADKTRWRQTLEYLRRYDAGEDPVRSFEQVFGVTVRDMDRALYSHWQAGRFATLVTPRVRYAGKLERRVLPQDEALYRLGDLAVEHDRFEAAYDYFDELADLDVASPFDARARSRRAIALVHEARVEEGDALIAALLAAGSEDPDVAADVAHYAFDRAVQEKDNQRPYSAQLARSLEYGARAVAANPLDLEAHFYVGLAHELDGNMRGAADALLNARTLSPASTRLTYNLARVLIKDGQFERGAQLIRRLYSASNSAEYRAKLKALEQDVLAGTVDAAELEDVL